MKYAILVASSGSTFVKEYDFFVSQGGTTQDWGRNWKIVEADSIEGARVIAIGQHGARAGSRQGSLELSRSPIGGDTMKGSGDFSIGSSVWPGTSKLIEEMGELHQVLGKLIATAGDTEHWSGDLRVKLIEEIGDARAAIRFFEEQNMTEAELALIGRRHIEKLALFRKWHRESGGPIEPSNNPHCSKCGCPVVTELGDGQGPGFFVCKKCLGLAAEQ